MNIINVNQWRVRGGLILGLAMLHSSGWAATCPGPDEFGYVCEDIPFAFESIVATGVDVDVDCDDCVSSAIVLPFPFEFYGTPYTQLSVSSNGFVTVLDDSNSGCCDGQALPEPGTPNGLIAGAWNDLCPACDPMASVKYQDMGDHFIVQFTDVPQCCGVGAEPVTMQYKLFPDHSIELHLAEVGNDGSQLSIGIEDQLGTVGLQYFLGNVAPEPAQAVRFVAEVLPPEPETLVDVIYPVTGGNPLVLHIQTGYNDGAGYALFTWRFSPREARKINGLTRLLPEGFFDGFSTALQNPGPEVVCAYVFDNATGHVIASDCDPNGPACGVEDQGLDNAEAFGFEMFARGSFDGWPALEHAKFLNFGNGIYQAEFLIGSGSFEYKIASEGWEVERTFVDGPTPLGTPVLLIDSAGWPNGTITLPEDDCYNWRMDASNPDEPILLVTPKAEAAVPRLPPIR